MPWMLPAAIIGSGIIGAAGSASAASTQSSAQQAAAQTQMNMFSTINQNNQPYMQGGYQALNQLLTGIGASPVSYPGSAAPGAAPGATTAGGTSAAAPAATSFQQFLSANPQYNTGGEAGLGQAMQAWQASQTAATSGSPANAQLPNIGPGPTGSTAAASGGITPGQFTSQFTPADLGTNLSPGYNFQLQQGGQAIRNADTPTQGALSGATLKDLMSFNQGLASTSYQQAYNNWLTTNNTIFGRLSGIAGLGQNASTNVGTAGTTLGTGAAQAGAAAGASNAAGIVGATNSIANNAVPLAYLMAQNTGGTGGGSFGAALANQNVSQYGYPSEASS